MADAIGICVFNMFAETVRAGMNGFAGKRIAGEEKTVSSAVKLRVGLQYVPGYTPNALVESVEQAFPLDAHSFDDFLIEVVEQFFTGITMALGNLGVEFRL